MAVNAAGEVVADQTESLLAGRLYFRSSPKNW
jgi:hypothetical protein